jgi:hypothetical protein
MNNPIGIPIAIIAERTMKTIDKNGTRIIFSLMYSANVIWLFKYCQYDGTEKGGGTEPE